MLIETGVIHESDNLALMRGLPATSVDLVYLDPPFFTGRDFGAFDDRWTNMAAYISWMHDRAVEVRRILRLTGSLYLHCDPHASHYLKVMLDQIFGARAFMDEIVWHYQTASGASRARLHRNHDTLFRYVVDPERATWNPPRQPWPQETLAKWQIDDDGRRYRTQRGKRYYVNPDGKLADDVWGGTLSSRSRERLGYPTQKPLALLGRIIAASSNPGDTVLDPFCGCGTTLDAAQMLGRAWIGIDRNPRAVELSWRRMLRNHGVRPSLRPLQASTCTAGYTGPYKLVLTA